MAKLRGVDGLRNVSTLRQESRRCSSSAKTKVKCEGPKIEKLEVNDIFRLVRLLTTFGQTRPSLSAWGVPGQLEMARNNAVKK